MAGFFAAFAAAFLARASDEVFAAPGRALSYSPSVRFKVASSSANSNGLLSQASALKSGEVISLSPSPMPVSMMTAVLPCSGERLMRLQISHPLSPGIITSSSTRSGWCACASSHA